MFNYTIEQWLFFFYLYCFLGWCFESTYVSVCSHHWVNRGFMHGPFLPLYGSGAIMMLVVSDPFADNILLTYVAGCIGATILEYITGAVMEALFKFRYWDYSEQKFQYKGYICLKSSLFWGVLTIIMTRIVQKPIAFEVLQIPETVMKVVVIGLTGYIAGDFAISFKQAMDLRDVLIKLEEMRSEMAKLEERMSQVMSNASEQVKTAVMAKKEYAESLKEELSQVGTSIQNYRPEVLAAWEEKIIRMQDLLDDNKQAALSTVRGEYRELKAKMENLSQHRELIIRSATPKRLYHLYHATTMRSKMFTEVLSKLKEEVSKKRAQM